MQLLPFFQIALTGAWTETTALSATMHLMRLLSKGPLRQDSGSWDVIGVRGKCNSCWSCWPSRRNQTQSSMLSGQKHRGTNTHVLCAKLCWTTGFHRIVMLAHFLGKALLHAHAKILVWLRQITLVARCCVFPCRGEDALCKFYKLVKGFKLWINVFTAKFCKQHRFSFSALFLTLYLSSVARLLMLLIGENDFASNPLPLVDSGIYDSNIPGENVVTCGFPEVRSKESKDSKESKESKESRQSGKQSSKQSNLSVFWVRWFFVSEKVVVACFRQFSLWLRRWVSWVLVENCGWTCFEQLNRRILRKQPANPQGCCWSPLFAQKHGPEVNRAERVATVAAAGILCTALAPWDVQAVTTHVLDCFEGIRWW